MSIGVASVRRAPRSSARVAFPSAPLAAAAIVGVAILMQIRLGAVDDVSWLITVVEKWLAGGTLYVDALENNPPASILVYTPAVALAHALKVWPEFTVAVFGFALVFANLALAFGIVGRAGLVGAIPPAGALLALVALVILPARAFDERDYFAALFGMPILALGAARQKRAEIVLWQAILAGLAAGAMAALKPPYALVAILPALWLLWRNGWKALVASPEYYAAGALGLVYMAAVPVFFPAFIANYLSFDAEVYARLRPPMLELIAAPGPLIGWILALALIKLAGRRIASPLVATPALGALGAYAAFLIQGKGWLYQLYPALLYLSLALAAAIGESARRPRDSLIACLAALAAAGLVLLLQRWPMPIALGCALAGWLVARWLSGARGRDGDDIALLATMAVASAIGVATVLFASEGDREPVLARALMSLGPHPTVGAISPTVGFGHPLSRDVGGVWAQRLPALVMTQGAMMMIAQHPEDPSLPAKLARYIRFEHDALVEDLRRNRPDAILIGGLQTPTLDWALADPDLKAARADYALYAADNRPGWPAELYVRKDLIGLRPSLAGAPDAGAAK